MFSPFVKDAVAVVTGASSGIGKAIAVRCGKAGMKVVMIDVLPMDTAVAEVTSAGGTAFPLSCDVSDAAAMDLLAQTVTKRHGAPTLLANNAGIARSPGGTAIGGSAQVFRKTMDVNYFGVVNGVQAFLPAMLESGKDGVIVNTGSKQGITKPPGNVAYNASKAALNAFTEGLQHELRETAGCKLRAHLLVPGWVNSDIMLNSKRADDPSVEPASVFFHEGKPASGAWLPAQVVDYFEAEMAKGVFYVLCPDNEVDVHIDNLRMTWAMGDLVEKRPPLSRWHADYKDKFSAYVAANPKP